MKIRVKLNLQFSMIIAAITILVFVAIYFILEHNTNSEFNERLKNRALLRATLHIENDYTDKKLFETFEQKYLSKLDGELYEIYDTRKPKSYPQKNKILNITNDHINTIIKNRNYNFSVGERQYVGIYYGNRGESFIVIVSAINHLGKDQLRANVLLLIVLFFGIVIISYVIGYFFSRNTLEPIVEITKNVNEISARNLDQRLKENINNDELSDLINTFNKLLQRLDNSFQLQRTFVSNASHELRTPLTHIIGELELALTKERDSDYQIQLIEKTLASSQQMKTLVNDLLMFAQTNIYEENNFQEELRLDELVFDVIGEVQKNKPTADISMYFDIPPDDSDKLQIKGNKNLLQVAFINLIENAIKYSDNKKVECRLDFDGKKLTFSVKDNGIGISKEDLTQIFQPFYRSSKALHKDGHGIGLALVDKIIKAHKAEIRVESELKQGTKFTVEFIV